MDTQTAGPAPTPNGVVIIKLHGHVRMGEPIDRFRNEIDGNLAQGRSKFLVDMSAVRSLDSSGIGMLVRSLSLAKQKGGIIKLVNVPQQASQTLRVTGVLRLFEVYENEAAALNTF
jgi:anti-sigma B factor antagonist